MTPSVESIGVLTAKILGVLGCIALGYGLITMGMDNPPIDFMGPLGPLVIGAGILAIAGIVGIIFGSPKARRAGLWAVLAAIPGAVLFGAGGLVGGGDNLGLMVGGVILIALGVPAGAILGLVTAKQGDEEMNSPGEIERVSTTTKV